MAVVNPFTYNILYSFMYCLETLQSTKCLSILLQFAFVPGSVHVRVAFQVPSQVVQTGVGLRTDLAMVGSHS